MVLELNEATELQRSVQGPWTHEFERLDYELQRPIPEQTVMQDSSSSSSSSSDSSDSTFYEGTYIFILFYFVLNNHFVCE